MAKQIIVTQNNYGIVLETQFLDSNKNPIDLTNYCVEVKIENNGAMLDVVTAEITGTLASIMLNKEHTKEIGLYKTEWCVMDLDKNITAQEDIYYFVKSGITSDKEEEKEENISIGSDEIINKFKEIDSNLFEKNKVLENINSVSIPSINEQLEGIMKYPVLGIELESPRVLRTNFIDVRYPYGHVNRYGADETGQRCSADAIQKTVDMCEKLTKNNYGIYPIKFGGGSYLITKTIQLKNKDFCKDVRPLTFVGELRKNITNNVSHGTTIIPKIPNHIGKNYANAFSVNIKYDGENNELDTTYYGGGTEAPICSNIAFHNLAFELKDEDADTYNINAIKGYRFRTDLTNIYCKNINRLIWQPVQDANGGRSYCDFSNYKDINLVGIKTCGLELMSPDNSVIEGITNHMLRSSADSVITIRNGGGIQINRFQHAFHFKEGTVGTTWEPRQDGTGANGTKALIKLANVEGISIDSLYVERQLLDYAIYCDSTSNVTVNNYYERFIGNGLICFRNSCKNFNISNINKHSNRVGGYNDVYFRENHDDVDNINISNFKANNWYNESLSLSSDLTILTKSDTSPKRNFKSNISFSQINKVRLQRVIANIKYTTSGWKVFDMSGADITDKYFKVEWRGNNGITFANLESNQTIFLKSVSEWYISDNIVPFKPIVEHTINGSKIHFINPANNVMSTTQKQEMSCMVEIETLI